MKDIEQLSHELHRIIDQKPALPQLIEQTRHLLNEFAGSIRWFHEFLESKLFDSEFFLSQVNSIWPNEIALLRSPDREFTILAYIWAPHTVDIIHDHGSWGVVAPFIQPFSERKFRRLDNGTTDGYAELEEISYETIKLGDTTYVLPLNEGIHQLENTTENYMVSLNVYGRPYRHGYVQFFDEGKRKVWRAFPPRTYKQVMAIRAMGNIAEPWAEQLLMNALKKDLPDFIKIQCQLSLRQLGSQK
jgi:predicted metal-dependent enzyme (double-stranded beta helix superfamily)